MESAKIPTSQGAGKIKGIIIYKPLKRIPVITKILVTTANICWITEKARGFQKNIYFRFIDNAKAFDSVDHNKLENSRDGNTRPPDLLLEKSVCRSGSNS